MNLVPIPWMRYKLEVLFETKLSGNLYLMHNNFDEKNYGDTTPTYLLNLLDKYNIDVDSNNCLFMYFPIDIDFFLKDLIISLKSLFKENIKVIVGGYKNHYKNKNESDVVYDIYTKYKDLEGFIDYSYLIDDCKCYEIFTSLSDTQRIYINPDSSCTISGTTLNYQKYSLNPNNAVHISFIELMDDTLAGNYVDCYLKGLTNNNNNFNYNF